MQIESIALRDWKGVNATYNLHRLNLLVGPNGSGKSALTQAIQWAVTGRTDLGAKNDDTALLAGSTGCAVDMRLDDGFTWTRELVIDRHENKVAQQLTAMGKRVSLRDGDARLHEHVGNFAPMFRLGEFVGLSPDKQRAEIVRLCAAAGGGELDEADFRWRIFLHAAGQRLGPGTVDALAGRADGGLSIRTKLGEDVAAEVDLIISGTVSPELHGPLVEAVSRALEAVLGAANESRREHDRGRAAAEKLAGRKVELQVASETVTALKQQLTKIRAQCEDVVGQLGHQAGRAAQKAAMVREVERLTAEIDRPAEPPSIPEGDADELNRQAAEIEAEPAPPIGDLMNLGAACRAAHAEDCAAGVELERAGKALASARHDGAEAESRLERARKDAAQSCWPAAKRFWELIEPAVDKSDHAVFVAMVDLGGLIAGQVGDIDDQVEPRQTLVAECMVAEAASREEAGHAKQKADETHKLATKLSADLRTADAEHAAAIQQHQLQQRESKTLRERATDIRSARRLADEAKVKLGRLEEDLVEAQRRLDEFLGDGGWVPVEQLEQQKTASDAAIVVIERKVDDRQVADRVDEEYRRAIADAERQGVRHDAAKAVANAIRAQRETMMNDLVAPLVGRMQTVLVKAAPEREPYCRLQNDRGKPIFELGWIVAGERRIAFGAMSGGERTTFGAALAHALVAMADPPLKLMMIEAGECDIDSFLNLAAGVSEVEVGNVLILSWQSAFVLNEWNVIDFAAAPAEVAA